MSKEWITVEEAAELTGLSKSRIHQFIYGKRVVARKEPDHVRRGIWYIDRHSLESFRASQFDNTVDDLFYGEIG